MDRQRLGLWGTVIFASLAAIGMAIQVYLIAGFLFGEPGWLDTHKDLGKLVHLTLHPHLPFRAGRRVAELAGDALAVRARSARLGPGVPRGRAVDVGGSDAAIHAFHGMLAPVVFVVALYVAWQAWLALKATPAPPPAAPA